MTRDELNAAVTLAIFDAETEPQTRAKWARVSELEEAIALHEPRDSVAWQVAAYGCVTAAMKAGDLERASMLEGKFAVAAR